ncbi:hypothetical protein [Streptomyces sp. NBC_00151]|uniref:hypothetical protein n=1 Tax=Streptomyces sp. NBC_00151 TaxID=2975669 RepID=UPI002DD9A11C|nr:hypothetical protein [Streptomyces sp. NBC_00151]WRZ39145.1 hypothetical protein OG915_14510 [Streptomyces sp. NBC_00151]
MSVIAQQILTIASVLVGALASFMATSLTEHARWKRLQLARWDEKRLAAYADYSNAVKTSVRLCYRMAAARNLVPTSHPIEIPMALNALAEAESERTAKWETVLLLGEPATIMAARKWHEAVWQLEVLVQADGTEAASFIDAYKESVRRRNVFHGYARSDLGVTSGEIPAPTFGSLRLTGGGAP